MQRKHHLPGRGSLKNVKKYAHAHVNLLINVLYDITLWSQAAHESATQVLENVDLQLVETAAYTPKTQPNHLEICLFSCKHHLHVVACSNCVGVKPAPSARGGLSCWDGVGLACGERTAGAPPSAALLFFHWLTFDCLYVLHDKDI